MANEKGRVSRVQLTGVFTATPFRGRVSRVQLTGTSIAARGRLSRIQLTGEQTSARGRVSQVQLTGVQTTSRGRISRVGLTGAASIAFTASAGPNAGADVWPATFQLFGSVSNGTATTHAWTVLSVGTASPNTITTGNITLTGGTTATPTVLTPPSAIPYDVTFRYTAGDGVNSSTADVTITIAPWVREWTRTGSVSRPVIEYYSVG